MVELLIAGLERRGESRAAPRFYRRPPRARQSLSRLPTRNASSRRPATRVFTTAWNLPSKTHPINENSPPREKRSGLKVTPTGFEPVLPA